MPPSALDRIHEIIACADGKRPAVFLDYDGTLTPIVSHPEDAWLSDSMRQTLQSLAARVPVAILTGRDLDDVRGRVLVDGVVYAGSHGFDIAGAGGLRRELGVAYLPVLDKAEMELREALDEIPGAQLERKHFSVAAHYRNVNETESFKVELAVDAVGERHRELRRMDGKKVYELLPDIDWNKAKPCSGSWKRWNLSAGTRSRSLSATIVPTKMLSARWRNAVSAFSLATNQT